MPPKKVMGLYNMPQGHDPNTARQRPQVSPEHYEWEKAVYSMSVVQSYIPNEHRRLRDLNGRTYKLYSKTAAADKKFDLGVNELVFQNATSDGPGEGGAKSLVARIVLGKDPAGPAARKYLEIRTEAFPRPKVASGKNVAVRASAWEMGGKAGGERQLLGPGAGAGAGAVPEEVATVDMWFVSKGFVRIRVHQDMVSPEDWWPRLDIEKHGAECVQKYRFFGVCEAFVEEDREVRRRSMVGREEPPDMRPISNGKMMMHNGQMKQATHEHCPPGWDDAWEGDALDAD